MLTDAIGRDTTAQALTWTFYLLMRHPRVVGELRKESKELQAKQAPNQSLSFEVLQAMSLPYTMAVFYESLRLYPPVPFEIKQSTSLTTLPDGTFLPKGAVVAWCPWAMGRSRRIWGKGALSFRPERWLEESEQGLDDAAVPSGRRQPRRFKTKTQFEFPVFNGGPRTCLGKKMAELQAVYVISRLVRDFDFEEVGIESSVKGGSMAERRSRNSLTLPMEGGLPCFITQLHRRQ